MGEMDWRNVSPVTRRNMIYALQRHAPNVRILCSHKTFRVETSISSLYSRDLGKHFQEKLDNLSHEQNWIFIGGTFWDKIERDDDLEIPTAGPPLLCGLFQPLGLRC